jgi:ribonucleoside-diphosphate reductase alpha chain
MRKRDQENAIVNQREVACGNLWITISEDNKGKPTRVFLNGGKMGTCQANLEAVGRLTTLCLQSNVSLELIIDQLELIKCHSCERAKGKLMGEGKKKEVSDFSWSCPDSLARELKIYSEVKNEKKKDNK